MKITKKFLTTVFVTLSILVSGCSTMQDVVKVKQSGSEGTTRNYAVTEAQAWEIAKTVFRWEGADAIEEHRDQHYMLTSSGVNLVSWGAVMGAWVEPVKDDETKVTVVTKRRVTVNVATTLTETTFHKRFAQAVSIVKKGQPLPSEAP
ncbi:hypothetical protein [Methylophilus luteus]|uniref:DUF4136 domain-containing protein n=1 Tax=Methylophilus luteus TaxID=640108 RepID=A0ABW3F696_9PROT